MITIRVTLCYSIQEKEEKIAKTNVLILLTSFRSTTCYVFALVKCNVNKFSQLFLVEDINTFHEWLLGCHVEFHHCLLWLKQNLVQGAEVPSCMMCMPCVWSFGGKLGSKEEVNDHSYYVFYLDFLQKPLVLFSMLFANSFKHCLICLTLALASPFVSPSVTTSL